MKAPLQTLSYDLIGYPFERSAALLLKRSAPKFYGIACGAANGLMLLSIFIATMPSGGQRYDQSFMPFFCFGLGLITSMVINKRFRRRYFKSIQNSPHRCGSRQLEMTSDGVTVSSSHSRWYYPWSHISDVMAGPENTVMLILGLYEYEPIPAKAFADAAARDSFVELASEMRAAQQVGTP